MFILVLRQKAAVHVIIAPFANDRNAAIITE